MSDKEVYDWNETYKAIKEGKFGHEFAQMFESKEDREKRLDKVKEFVENGSLLSVNFERVT